MVVGGVTHLVKPLDPERTLEQSFSVFNEAMLQFRHLVVAVRTYQSLMQNRDPGSEKTANAESWVLLVPACLLDWIKLL